MKTVSRLTLSALALVLAAGTDAWAGDKIFRFKNGRKVVAEVLDETPTTYVVRAQGGGRLVFAKDTIISVEDPPPEGKPFLGPKPAEGEKRPEAGTGEATAPATPSPSAEPLASADEIASAKKALGAVPPRNPDNPDADAARVRAINTVGEGCSLGTLVSICAEPSTNLQPNAPPERLIALELVVAAGERARPVLARALLLQDLSRGTPRELFTAIQKVGPDPQGEIETALLAKANELQARGDPVAVLAPAWKVVGTQRSLPTLYEWLVRKEKPDAATLSPIALAIVAASPAPDDALAPLLTLLNQKTLPANARLACVLDVLGKSPGRAAGAIGQILDAVEAQPVATEKQSLQAQNACLASGYAALAAIPTEGARERVARGLRGAPSAERRVLVLTALTHMRRSPEWPSADFLDTVVVSMSEGARTEAELKAYAQALAHLTERAFGTDPGAWRSYVQSLRR